MLKINNIEYSVLSSEIKYVSSTYNGIKGYSILVSIDIEHNDKNGYISFFVDFFDNKEFKNIVDKSYNELPTDLNSKINSIEIFDTKNFIDCIDSNVDLKFGKINGNKIDMALNISDNLIKIEYAERININKK